MSDVQKTTIAEEPGEAPPDLRPWGYAPGDYSIYCADCEQVVTADKRAIRCFQCALEASK
jgi:hypothetical protein